MPNKNGSRTVTNLHRRHVLLRALQAAVVHHHLTLVALAGDFPTYCLTTVKSPLAGHVFCAGGQAWALLPSRTIGVTDSVTALAARSSASIFAVSENGSFSLVRRQALGWGDSPDSRTAV